MQRSLLRLAVGLLTFGIGVSATMFWIAYRTPHAKRFKTTSCQMRPLLPLPPPPPMDEELPPPPPAMWADELSPPEEKLSLPHDEELPIPLPPPPSNTAISVGRLEGKAVSLPQPNRPEFYSLGSSGPGAVVVVGVVVDEDGRVITARAISGHPFNQQEAVRAAYQARFAPTLRSGQPVKVSGTLTYNFVRP